MKDYEINEKDIQSVIHHLELHDPKNADRDYAIQLLGIMQEIAGNLVRSDAVDADLIDKALQKSKQ
jgi:hypothetical protein